MAKKIDVVERAMITTLIRNYGIKGAMEKLQGKRSKAAIYRIDQANRVADKVETEIDSSEHYEAMNRQGSVFMGVVFIIVVGFSFALWLSQH